MDDATLNQALQAISGQDPELRKAWYSPAANAYQATRPSYPSELIDKAIKGAKLSSSSRILELGCGPGTATVAFAQLGFPMVCLEPNPDFWAMARMNCRPYPSVQVINQSFEDWDLEPEAFDAVLAASSMHWIPAEVYQRHAPALGRTEDRATQERILSGLGQMMLDSGRFHNLVTATVECSLTYTPDQTIALLGTYSPYLKLDHRSRSALFAGLRQRLIEQGVGEIQLSYLSAYHVAQKIPSVGP